MVIVGWYETVGGAMVRVDMVRTDLPEGANGAVDDRIEMRVALTPQGELDETSWLANEDGWVATRSLPGRDTPVALDVVRLTNGWALRRLDDDDEPLWVIETRTLRPGDLATLRRPDGEVFVYRIVNVSP